MATVDNKHHAAGEVFDNTSGLRIIDLSNFETRKHEIAGQLISSAKDVGFFFVKGAAKAITAEWQLGHCLVLPSGCPPPESIPVAALECMSSICMT